MTDPKTDATMPGKGDAVVVCRQDGSSSFFLLDIDHRDLLKKLNDGDELAAAELGQLEAAHKAMALWFASQNGRIMGALVAAMNAPGSLGDVEFPNVG